MAIDYKKLDLFMPDGHSLTDITYMQPNGKVGHLTKVQAAAGTVEDWCKQWGKGYVPLHESFTEPAIPFTYFPPMNYKKTGLIIKR